MFVFCSYWKTWSRRFVGHGLPQHIELDLTPVNAYRSETWEEIKEEKFRAHGTAKGRGDIHTDALPQDVIATMVKMLGEKLTHRLLHHDYLSEVPARDIVLANRLHTDNDGVPFEKIKSGKKTTPEEAVLKLRELRGPAEDSHIEADAILCQLLISLGCAEVAEEFEKLDKWYS